MCMGEDRIKVSGTCHEKRMNNPFSDKDRGSGNVCAATDNETVEAVPWPNWLIPDVCTRLCFTLLPLDRGYSKDNARHCEMDC